MSTSNTEGCGCDLDVLDREFREAEIKLKQEQAREVKAHARKLNAEAAEIESKVRPWGKIPCRLREPQEEDFF